MTRVDWDSFFLRLAKEYSLQTTCLRRRVGAILARGNRQISAGFNGAPSKEAHCIDIGCLRREMNIPSGERLDLCRAIHAERNAIDWAKVRGIKVEGATLYCTTYPCRYCAEYIVENGISKVIYEEGYPDEKSAEIMKSIEVIKYKQKVLDKS